MTIDEIFAKVKTTIADSCGKVEEDIQMQSTLFDDLEIDSIDMVDILFTLETEYDISLKIGEIDREARKELGDGPYEIDGIITQAGLDAIKKRMPEVPEKKLQFGISIHEIVKIITVESLCKAVLSKIEEQETTAASKE